MKYKFLLLVLTAVLLVQGTPLQKNKIKTNGDQKDDLEKDETINSNKRKVPTHEGGEKEEGQSNVREKRANDDKVRVEKLQLEEDDVNREGPNKKENSQNNDVNALPIRQKENHNEGKDKGEHGDDEGINTNAKNRRVGPYIANFRSPFKITPMEPALNSLRKFKKRCFCNFPCGHLQEFEVIGCEGPYTLVPGGCGGYGCGYPGFGIGCGSGSYGCGGFGGWGGSGGCGSCGGCGGIGVYGGCGGCGGCGATGGYGGYGGIGGYGGCGGCGGIGGYGGCGIGGCGVLGGLGGCGGCGYPTITEHVHHCK